MWPHRRRRAEGRDRLHLSARRRRVRCRPSRPRLRRLSGQPRRCRRASCRCHSAGRRLHRKGRPLRQFRGPGAARPPRDVSAGRGEGRLGDPARAVRRARQALPYDNLELCARPSSRDAPHFADHGEARAAWRRRRDELERDRRRPRRSTRLVPLGSTMTRFLPDQSDRARQRDHGRVQPRIRRRRQRRWRRSRRCS